MKTKAEWIEAARQVLTDRIKNSEKAMKRAQEAANSEEKSSAGDKYETARAIGQLERDMHARQLDQAMKEIQVINKISLSALPSINSGSLIVCKDGLYFLSLGLGKLEFGDEKCVMLSAASPLGKEFIGKGPGDKIEWNKETIEILEVL